MSKKQIILSEFDDQNVKYSDLIFPYLDEIELDNYECYLFYYCPFGTIDTFDAGTNYRDLSKIKYKSDLVIWVAEDTLESVEDYNWYSDKKPEGLLYIERICRMYPEKKFILMTEQYEMNALCTVNNLKFVDLTPICFRFDKSKINYNVCTTKHNNSKKKWVFLNSSARIYRIVSLSYILSKHIDELGHITCSDFIFEEVQYYEKIYSLVKHVFQFDLKTALQLNEGYNILKNKLFKQAEVPYWTSGGNVDKVNEIPEDINDNSVYFTVGNYNNIIKLYEDVKLEILSSGHFSEPTPCFSEKEIQWVYGRNFLIYLGSPRSIQWLRKWGFDVFDDVVDHSYDLIEDPSERMIRAIDDNIHLLDGSTDLDQLWKDREERFNQNCLIADNIQEKLDNECKKQILERLDEYSIPYKKQ